MTTVLPNLRSLFLLALAALVWSVLAGQPAWAQRILVAEEMGQAQVLLDDSGTQSFAAMKARFERGEGAAHDDRKTLPIGGPRTAWLRIYLPESTAALEHVLAVPHPGMDRVNLYTPDASGGWQAQYSGDLLPVLQWPIRYLYPAIAFTQQPSAAPIIYMEVRHSHPISVRWHLTDRMAFDESSKLWHLMLGGYLGLIALVLVLSVYNGLSWRDPLHFFYAAYVLSLALTQLSLTGLGGEYLWPNNVWWNNMASVVVPTASVTVSCIFLLVLMRDHRNARWPCAALGVVAAIALVNIGGFLFIGWQPFFRLANLAFPLTFVVYLGCLVWYAQRRPAVGLWMLAGYCCVLVGASFTVLRNLQLMPLNLLTQYGVQIGSALEIPLLLIGLYARSRERRDNQLRADNIAKVDPLTGVASAKVLMERLEALVSRQQRDAERGAVLRLRIANLVDIRNQYGLEAAQSALVHAAACITQNIGEEGIVGRYSDGDFVALLEGRASHPHTLDSAQRIIAQGRESSRLLPPRVRLNLLVVASLAPLPERNAQALMARMDATLDEMGLRPSRVLRFLEDEPMSDLALI